MYYWPKEDPKYDSSKSYADNYRTFRKLFEKDVTNENLRKYKWCSECDCILKNQRYFKGCHLDWNYTEMLRDLIDQGLVKVPITDFDVVFVEWASGNLDNVKPYTRIDKALYNWNDDEKDLAIRFKPKIESDDYLPWDELDKAAKPYKYNDSNREEFTPTPAETTPVVPSVSSPATSTTDEATQPTSPVEHQQSADTSQATVQQPTPVQYGGNQYIVPAQQQHKSWIPNVDYVDPNFIPEWEQELMMKEAMMGAQGRALMQQMGMIPQYQPPQYQTVQPVVSQPPRFTSPEQVVSYILANQPELVNNETTNEIINNALEGTFIGADE